MLGEAHTIAEAKDLTVQATTSLPLHGMAGLYGLRPAPAMPGEEMDRTRIVRFLAIFVWHVSCLKLFWRLFLRLFGRFLVHFEVLLGLCWPIWGLCWGHVRPSWGYVAATLTPGGDFRARWFS